jgi:hypothetical protein
MTSTPGISVPNSGHTGPVPSEASLHVEASRLARFGSAEAAIARVGVALDQQQRRSREHRRRAESLGHEQAFERIRMMRKAAKKQMGAGVASALSQLVEGVASFIPGASGAGVAARGAPAQVLGLGAELAGAGLTRGAERARTDAKEHEILSDMRGGEARAHAADADDARSLRDRAWAHLDSVARSRAEARLRTLRG